MGTARRNRSPDTTKNCCSTGDMTSHGRTFVHSQKAWFAHAQRQPRQLARHITPSTSGENVGPSTWTTSKRTPAEIAEGISVRNAMETTRECVSLTKTSKSTRQRNKQQKQDSLKQQQQQHQ